MTNRKIGIRLGLSESCVKNIVQRLFGKASVNTRGQLVRAALQGSLVSNGASFDLPRPLAPNLSAAKHI